MSGADPRLQAKSATEVENQLERRRLAAEREDAKQQELEQLLFCRRLWTTMLPETCSSTGQLLRQKKRQKKGD